MGKFLTSEQTIQQYGKDLYFTKHNQIYEDKEGIYHFVPRFFMTDGYTISDALAPLAGGRFEEDIRCCIGHDFWCRYGVDLQITISEARMWQIGVLDFTSNNYPNEQIKLQEIARNVPKMYLKIIPISFTKSNQLFYEMLESCETSFWKRIILGIGVYFNINWFLKPKRKLRKKDIYKSFL